MADCLLSPTVSIVQPLFQCVYFRLQQHTAAHDAISLAFPLPLLPLHTYIQKWSEYWRLYISRRGKASEILSGTTGCSQASFYLPFAFTIMYGSGRLVEKQGRPGSIHHVSNVRWTWDGCRGEEGHNCQNNVQDQPFERSLAFSDSTPYNDGNYSSWPVRNSLSTLVRIYLNIGPSPLHPPRVHSCPLTYTHMMNAPRPSPF